MSATITGTRHVLAVPGLKRAVAYYRDLLGFDLLWEVPGQWACLGRDRASVMLGECPDEVPPSALGDHAYFAYFEVDDARALFDELRGRGVTLRSEIEDQPWGQREFAVETPDGHRIMFGQAIPVNPPPRPAP